MFLGKITAVRDRFRRPATAWRLVVVVTLTSAPFAAMGEEGPTYRTPQKVAELANETIDESSGLAVSRRHAGLFFTHNDSGDQPRLYAFDTSGRDRGKFKVKGAYSIDWEDMASFTLGGRPYLLVGDVGDNHRVRAYASLYLIAEPELGDDEAKLVQRLKIKYPGGPVNCEAVAIEPATRQVFLASKEMSRDGERTPSRIFLFTWPNTTPTEAIEIREAVKIDIPAVTAMDITPDGRRAILLTYKDAYEFSRGESEDWIEAFQRTPRRVEMPTRSQGESICYGHDSRTLFLTSEKLPTPLLAVPRAEEATGE
jgi:hypothetical protein